MKIAYKLLFNCLCAALCAAPLTLPAANRTWDGGGGDNLASTAANWDGDNPITNGDAITFNATSGNNCTWDISTNVAGMSFASTYSGSFTNATTLNCTNGTANFTWDG
ncbi:MAG: hypothetical protein KKE37_06900, partial [Verrucomicrobia bacterium]|nr:hypothetical protein [Verrucomicrobiota bacterium]